MMLSLATLLREKMVLSLLWERKEMSVLGDKSLLSIDLLGDKKGMSEECRVVLDNLFLSYAPVEAFLRYKLASWGPSGETK
jgi:hypothetical protein